MRNATQSVAGTDCPTWCVEHLTDPEHPGVTHLGREVFALVDDGSVPPRPEMTHLAARSVLTDEGQLAVLLTPPMGGVVMLTPEAWAALGSIAV